MTESEARRLMEDSAYQLMGLLKEKGVPLMKLAEVKDRLDRIFAADWLKRNGKETSGLR